MTSFQGAGATARTVTGPDSLRSLLDARRVAGRNTPTEPVPLGTAIEWLVPLCNELSDIHAQGYALLVYPSNLVSNGSGGFRVSSELAAVPPSHPADIACMAPEVQRGQLGSARASLYSLGAIFYELVTGASAGRGMRRPQDLVPGLPPSVEVVLAKALIADPAFRPEDLDALAQALYELAPSRAAAPRSGDRPSLLHDVTVDVSLSMLPPAAPQGPVSQAGLPQPSRPGARPPTDEATVALAALKAKLEADRSPRYIVVRDGMDHGPFSAVELLQQIASHAFHEADLIADRNLPGSEKPVKDWPDFAPFAEHARRHRDIAEEKAAIVRGVAKESNRTKSKALLGLLLLGMLLAAGGAWFVARVGTRNDDVEVLADSASNVEAEGNIASKKGIGGNRRIGSAGGIPQLGGGLSCEAAQSAYVEELKMSGGGPADITRGQYGAIMNSGNYFSHCGVPSSVAVSICVAVQSGRAVGVTVNTTPNHGSKACITSAVRKMGFPANPKLDVVRVNFAAN